MNNYQCRQLAGMNEVLAGCPESTRLLIAHIAFRERLAVANEATQRRRAFIARIRNLAENGKVALVEGGMDCDGVRYSGKVRLVDATVAEVDAHIEHACNWADGPIHFSIEAPSVAEAEIEYESRDLGMEAFEDGHSHCLHV